MPFDAETEMVVCPEVVETSVYEVQCRAAKAWCYKLFNGATRNWNLNNGVNRMCRGFGAFGSRVSGIGVYAYTQPDCPAELVALAMSAAFTGTVTGWKNTLANPWYDSLSAGRRRKLSGGIDQSIAQSTAAAPSDGAIALPRQLSAGDGSCGACGCGSCVPMPTYASPAYEVWCSNTAFQACDPDGQYTERCFCAAEAPPPPPPPAECALPCGDSTCGEFAASRTCGQLTLAGCSCSGCCLADLPSSSTYSYDPEAIDPAAPEEEESPINVTGTLCAKSLWDAYVTVIQGPVMDSFEQVAGHTCDGPWYPNLGWAQRQAIGCNGGLCMRDQNSCFWRFIRNQAQSGLSDLLTNYFFDDNEDLDINADLAVAEGVYTIMEWYDQCGNQCQRHMVMSPPPPPPAAPPAPSAPPPTPMTARQEAFIAYDTYRRRGPPRPANWRRTQRWRRQLTRLRRAWQTS